MGVDRRRRTPYIEIAMQMVLLGGGLGLTTAPATESIMGSLSADKAGVGSAVNDTTRELGGTLGVAIVGSVFASIYSSRLRQRGGGRRCLRRFAPRWSGRWPRRSRSSVRLPQGVIPDVRAAVNTAFLDGLQIGSLVSAGIALAAAVIVAWLLPARARQAADRAGRTRGGVRMSTTPTRWTDGHGTVQYFTRSDGSRLRYFTAGSGPALVLMHTIRTQLDYFHRVIPQLWDSFTVYALDLPGMGWSDIVPGARYEEPRPAGRGGRVRHRPRPARRHPGRGIARRRARAARAVDLKERVSRVVAFNTLRLPERTRARQLFARFIISSVRMPGLGPVFAAMENRPIMKGVMRGGVVDKRHAARRFHRRAPKERTPQGLSAGGPGGLPQPEGIRQGARPLPRRGGTGDAGLQRQRTGHGLRSANTSRVCLPTSSGSRLPDTGHFSALERPNEVARILRRSN